MPPIITRIAHLLNVDEAAAVKFCDKVQRSCKGRIPSQSDIERCLKLYPEFKHDAKAISERVLCGPVPRRRKQRGAAPQSMKRSKFPYGDWTTD